MRRLARLHSAFAVSMLLLTVAAVACGDGAKDVFDDPPDASQLAVRLSEYKIETKGDASAAVTKLVAQNTGTVTHDIAIVRTDLAPDALPRNGADVDESKLDVLAKKTDLKRRDRVSLDVKLQPGNYVLYCNVSGHYQLGMRTRLTVK